jgi:nucleotidyltransferase/DNA polymerase involved in DNA repair
MTVTPLVEPLSLDEAFLDLRGCVGRGAAPEAARRIKERVRAETGLAASVGVAASKFLARLAGDLGKPDGLLVVRPEEADAFLAPLPVGRLWGVGAAGERRLHALGLRTVGQVAALPERALEGHLGAAGRQLWLLARGQDDRPVVPDREAQSVSVETAFETGRAGTASPAPSYIPPRTPATSRRVSSSLSLSSSASAGTAALACPPIWPKARTASRRTSASSDLSAAMSAGTAGLPRRPRA